MNLRMYSMALLVSALPIFAYAEAHGISLNRGDFVAAEKVDQDGSTVVSVKLSKSGKAKFKKLNKLAIGKPVHAEATKIAADLKLRAPAEGDQLEPGPYSANNAEKKS